MMKITSPNLRTTIAKLQSVPAGIQPKIAAELYASCEEVMTDAKEETPVDTGNLRASGHVQQPEISGTTVSVTLGFGGPAGAGNQGESNSEDVGYATPVHENVGARHTVGKAKYLEDPLQASISRIQQNLANAVHESFRDEGLS